MSMPVVYAGDGKRQLSLYRWGLLPFWAKNESLSYKLINARSEAIDNKPSFREAFKKRRCVVLASGFYEWKKTQNGKVPHFITLVDGKLFSFAGLCEHWKSPDGKRVDRFTIIITEANETMKPLHDRMPALLLGDEVSKWLDPANTDAKELLRSTPDDSLEYSPVSTKVNSPKNQSADLLDRV